MSYQLPVISYVPFGRTQFAPTLWTKSVTVGAQSLRPPIDWDIIPTQVPKQYVLSEPHQMAVSCCLFTDYCLLITDN
ncbi:MAG: hypothetical protein EWV79_07210 [Microcystis aeruginosa Ma_MB_S_20031200_S102D]|nr:MAG: hypothetical protein EWV79_07210 [Microcystis aeruginosa Ma_MB_S_20031200_S102D]